MKRLVQKRNNNSLAIKESVVEKYFDSVDEIEITTRSKGTFRIYINDLVLEGRKRENKFYCPAKFWEKV